MNGEKLWGKEVELSLDTLVDGGTWLRPLRGDMLRTPGSIPQVAIILEGGHAQNPQWDMLRTPTSIRGEGHSYIQ